MAIGAIIRLIGEFVLTVAAAVNAVIAVIKAIGGEQPAAARSY